MTFRTRIEKFSTLKWQPALVVLVIAAIIRVAIAVWLPTGIIWEDGHRYRKVADNLLAGQGFGSLVDNSLSVPTQPLLIAAVDLVTDGSQRAERVFFALLGAITCVFGYMLARRLFGPLAALFAGCLLAIYPYLAYTSALHEYPQTFFIFIMGGVFLLLYRFLDGQRKSNLFLCGLCLGLAILSVPTVLLFAPLLTFTLWRGGVREAVVRTLILVVAVCIPVGSWVARNYAAYGHFILVNEAGGRNFWYANNETYYQFGKEATVLACHPPYEHSAYCHEFRELGIHVGDGGKSDDEIVLAYEKATWGKGLRFIRDSPVHFFILMGKKMLQYWNPIPDAVTKGANQGGEARTWLAVGSFLPILVLGVIGFAQSAPQWRRLLPIYCYFMAFMAAYSIYLPTTRYRLQLDFFLIIFAAGVLAKLWKGGSASAPVAGPLLAAQPAKGRLPESGSAA